MEEHILCRRKDERKWIKTWGKSKSPHNKISQLRSTWLILAKTKCKSLETLSHITTTKQSACFTRSKTDTTQLIIRLQRQKWKNSRSRWSLIRQRNRPGLGINFAQKKKYAKTLSLHKWWSTRRAILAQVVPKRGISWDPQYLFR